MRYPFQPISRGLGSSAACIVAGVISANEVMGRVLNLSQMIEVASQIEGHSDNVLPAFLGGFTIALLREGRIFYHQLPFLREVEMVVCIPDYTLSTEEMRKVLPSSYPRDKVVFTLSSLAYLLGSIFTGDKEGFFLSLEDEIHQPYRGAKIKGFSEVKEYIQKRNLGNVAISGSGPALILFFISTFERGRRRGSGKNFSIPGSKRRNKKSRSGRRWSKGEKAMSLIVQKYGGSSLADLDKIRLVASRVKSAGMKGMNW